MRESFLKIVDKYSKSEITLVQAQALLSELGYYQLLNFYISINYNINELFVSEDFGADEFYFELKYLLRLKESFSSRDPLISEAFIKFLDKLKKSNYDKVGLYRHYGIFRSISLKFFDSDIPIVYYQFLDFIATSDYFPELSKLDQDTLSILTCLHDVALINRLEVKKYSLSQPFSEIRIVPEDISKSIEIDFCFNQIMLNIDNHWNNTTFKGYISLVKFFLKKGLQVTPVFKYVFTPSPVFSPSILYITHHTSSHFQENKMHFKNSHLSRFLQFDPIGFAGYSSVFDKGLNMQVDVCEREIENFIQNLTVKYRSSLYAKHPQKHLLDLSSKFSKPSGRTILCTMQLPYDRTQDIAYIRTQELALLLSKLISNDDVLIVKPHPMDDSLSTRIIISSIARHNIFISDDNLYSLFEISDLVVTSNSGTGFEALLFGLDVICAGKVDYHQGVVVVKDEYELLDALHSSFPHSIQWKHKFVYIFLKSLYNVDFSEEESLEYFNKIFSRVLS